jgi:hypothetical protein
MARSATDSNLRHQWCRGARTTGHVGSIGSYFSSARVRPSDSWPTGRSGRQYEAYIEVPFDQGDKTVYPDGLIRIKRGDRTWTALVEVKTGTNELKADQLEEYLEIAKEQNFNAVITISNGIPPAPGQHPTAVDRRKLRKVALYHLPWVQVLSAAVLQKDYRGVADPDQAWILGELIRYLEHPRSGAMAFEDMGPNWVAVREAVRAGTLRANDKGCPTSRPDSTPCCAMWATAWPTSRSRRPACS